MKLFRLVTLFILFVLNSYAQDTINGRCLPSPFKSPPFPMSDFSGGQIIGQPNNTYPDYIEQALSNPSSAWTKTGMKIYGWIDASYNYSTSTITNSPMEYDLVPNRAEIDQAVIHIERIINTVQTSHIAWGFVFDNIYGIDYRYTLAKGYFSDQLLKYNHLYGYDPTQFYGLIYIPDIAEGMVIKIGRSISPSDIEAQWAPVNYLFSHSLMFGVDPYTFTGISTLIRLSQRLQVEIGFHGGNDMSPFSNSSQLNGMAMLRWVSKNNSNSIYTGTTSIGRGEFKAGHDDLQMIVTVWGHKFSDNTHMMSEVYYMWEYNAAIGGTAIYGQVQYGQGGGMGAIVNGLSPTMGFVNYFQILLNNKNYISIRNGALDDIVGNRTGYATWYTDHTIGMSHNFSKFVMMRPEIRYDRSWDKDAYNTGTKNYQFTIATDLLIQF